MTFKANPKVQDGIMDSFNREIKYVIVFSCEFLLGNIEKELGFLSELSG